MRNNHEIFGSDKENDESPWDKLTEMAKIRDKFERQKKERLERQRVQELVERDFNSRLLTVEKLEEELLDPDSGVEKDWIDFEGRKIEIYNLNGLDFAMLRTAVDYKINYEYWQADSVGSKTAKEVMENPKLWEENREKAERNEDFMQRGIGMRSGMISASYINSKWNLYASVGRKKLYYGFEKVEADSIFQALGGDAATPLMKGDEGTKLSNPNIVDNLEKKWRSGGYNEVVIRRYKDNGEPKLPDYIVTEFGEISEYALKHARYFGIPIVNIDMRKYDEKNERRISAELDQLNSEMSYFEISKKLKELRAIQVSGVHFSEPMVYVGMNVAREGMANRLWSKLSVQFLEKMKMEQIKRLEFLEDILKGRIMKLEEASVWGVTLTEKDFSDVANLKIEEKDVWQGIYRSENEERELWRKTASGCNEIGIDFALEEGDADVGTVIVDGGRVFDEERADGKEGDSVVYDKFKPLVEKYLEALKENRSLN